MSQTSFVVTAFTLDNRCPLPEDLSNQLKLALSNNGYLAQAVTVSTLAQSNMTTPIGTSQAAIELASPDGTTNDAIVAFVTAAILALDVPTSPALTVTSVVVFNG
jgi:hypothetical protein